MEELRRSIGLRSYGQRDPLQEYKAEAYHYFEELMNNVRLQICTGLFRSTTNLQAFENMLAILSRSARLQGPEAPAPNGSALRPRPAPVPGAAPTTPPRRLGGVDMPVSEEETDAAPASNEVQLPRVTVRRETPKVGRNDPCPCGSGKKYKHCHGK
jgi:preprotein translocase subunit SecA